jgi:hypothetical protein
MRKQNMQCLADDGIFCVVFVLVKVGVKILYCGTEPPFSPCNWGAILYLEFLYMQCCFWCGVIFLSDRTFYWPQTRAIQAARFKIVQYCLKVF